MVAALAAVVLAACAALVPSSARADRAFAPRFTATDHGQVLTASST